MSLTQIMLQAFEVEAMSVEDLIQLSILVDAEKSNVGFLEGVEDYKAVFATVIVALIGEKSTARSGNEIYNRICSLIVEKNRIQADNNNGHELYERIIKRPGVSSFEVSRRKNGFAFIFKSAEGKVLAMSEPYSKLDTCLRGVESVKRCSESKIRDLTAEDSIKVSNPKYEVYKTSDGSFRWRLVARNGEVLVKSENHNNRDDCMKTISDIQKNAKAAKMAWGD